MPVANVRSTAPSACSRKQTTTSRAPWPRTRLRSPPNRSPTSSTSSPDWHWSVCGIILLEVPRKNRQRGEDAGKCQARGQASLFRQHRLEKNAGLTPRHAVTVETNSLAAASLSALQQSTENRRMNDRTTEDNAPERPSTPDGSRKQFRPLRAWPAFLLVLLMLATRFGPGISEEGAAKYWMVAVFGPLLGCLLLLIWWLAASRATWRERLLGFLGLAASAAITITLAHPTMRGPATTYFTIPMGFFLFALTAALLKKSPPAIRSGTAALLAFAGFSVSMLLRSDGLTGDYKFSFHARWKQTTEDAMLAAQTPATPKTTAQIDRSSLTNSLAHPEWPEFRGSDRAGRSLAPGISTNWNDHPPKLLWKIPVGPGWSSLAVAGRMLFTQDQRGPKETVVCYDADSGREIWKTEIDGRLDDPMGGPGPRATPTLAKGALYVVGSTGAFLRLNPVTGEIVWKKELTQVADSKVPMWGFSSSPLVLGPVVVVYGGGQEKGLLAFETASGDLRWSAPCPVNSYGSPQLNNILGEDSILMLSSSGLLLLDPANGKTRLDYEWKIPQFRALQPHVVGSDTILLPTGMNMGTRAYGGPWI